MKSSLSGLSRAAGLQRLPLNLPDSMVDLGLWSKGYRSRVDPDQAIIGNFATGLDGLAGQSSDWRVGKRCDVACSGCGIRDRALCASLSDEELAPLSALKRRRHFAKGEPVVWAGDENMIFANVVSGVLKLAASTADGREQIVGLVYPADFIGRPYASSTRYNVVALTDAELCVFSRKQFEQALSTHDNLKRLLLRRTLDELDHSRQWMLLLGRKTAEERVASFLVQMARRLGRGGCARSLLDEFVLPLSRAQIADVLGLTIETVSRQLTRLRIAGVIDLPTTRSIRVLNEIALSSRAEQG